MITSPEANHIYGLPNVYDPGNTQAKTIFFYPAYLNYKPFHNRDGVSDVIGAMLYELNIRHELKYHSSDVNKLTKRKAEYAFTIKDAIMRRSGTLYPVADLNDRAFQIENDLSSLRDMYVGRLELKDGKVE